MPQRCNSRQSKIGWLGRSPQHFATARRRAVQDSNGRVGRAATELVNGHQPAADNTGAKEHAVRREQGRIRRGVKLGHDSLVRVRRSRRVGAEGDIEDRGVVREARNATQELRKR